VRLYYAGAEVPSHRKVLREIDVTNVALSFIGLQRRVKNTAGWKVAEKFPDGTNILIDSGAYTVNKDEDDKYSQADLLAISDAYQTFVAANIDTVEMVTEFDALSLGREWIENQREDFYDDLPRDKFMPLWHPEWGLDALRELSEKYLNVGVLATAIGGRNLAPHLNSLDCHLHGVAMTKVDEMSAIKWNSVSSTSWLSPQRYGDTIIWTGRELKRYPKDYKERARKQHRTLFERNGFDHVKIENDDPTEVLRLSAWSWGKLVEDIEKRQGRVANPQVSLTAENAESEGEAVDNPSDETRKSLATRNTREPSKTLPILGVTRTEEEVDGETVETNKVNIRSDSQRMCNSCFLSSKCPEFQEDANCAYNIPVTLRTKQDFIDMHNGLIEMQTQRVYFMRFAEELEGGYADPNLSTEIDRLNKMMKAKHEMEQEGWSISITGRGSGPAGGGGEPGMLSRMFGAGASERAQALPGPVEADPMAEDIVEGHVVGE